MTNKIIWWTTVFLLVATLTACVASTETALPTILPPTSTASMTATAWPARIYRNTPSQGGHTPTPTPEPTSIPKPSPTETEIPLCSGYGSPIEPDEDFGLLGTIVYQRDRRQGLYTIGGTPLRQAQLPNGAEGEFVVYGFSPNGEWLAYSPIEKGAEQEFKFETPTMVLLSYTGERIEQFLDVSGFEDQLRECCYEHYFYRLADYSFSYWINNALLYVELISSPTEGSMSAGTPKVFDPFAGAWRAEWLDTLPERFHVVPTRDKPHSAGISPDLSRVLYRTRDSKIVLRDLLTGTNIWSAKFGTVFGDFIRWSPDSRFVAVGAVGHINPSSLLISRDGEAVKWTGPNFLELMQLAWSPNSRYLALFGEDADTAYYTYVYDIVENRYRYRCPMIGVSEYFPELIWSPDNVWIAITALDSPLQVLNVQTGEVFKLLDDVVVVGWSDKFPVEWP